MSETSDSTRPQTFSEPSMSDSTARTTRFKITRLEDRIVPSSMWASFGDNNSNRGGSSKKHGSSKKKHGSSKKKHGSSKKCKHGSSKKSKHGSSKKSKHGSSKKGYKNAKCKKG